MIPKLDAGFRNDLRAPGDAAMPLVRHHEHFHVEQSEGIYFLMADGSVEVVCKVSYQALRDRGVRDGGGASPTDTFVRHRRRIETIAAEKYAHGHRPHRLIIVLSRDLSPLPM